MLTHKITSGIILKTSSARESGLDVSAPYLQASFCHILLGRPGSGKTTLIENLLTHDMLYKKKFDKIVLFSPLAYDFVSMTIEEDYFPILKLTSLITLLEKINQEFKKKDKIAQILLIFDDIIASLKEKENDPTLCKLFFNRRHFMSNIHIHFLITTQKWTMLPHKFRAIATMIYAFPLSTKEWKSVYNEIYLENKKELEKILPAIWSSTHNFLLIDIISGKTFQNFDRLFI